jgi:hydroxylamine reductase (hybrid-cluster protein)
MSSGNYGGAWYRQKKDFAEFPGAILMTTNCIMDPSPAYADRIFTTGEVRQLILSCSERFVLQTQQQTEVLYSLWLG